MTTDFNARASDDIHWRRHVLTTDLTYMTEEGKAFTASDRWTIAAGATEYLEFRIPAGTVVRVYSRLTAVEGELFTVDLCAATSITPGTIELTHTNMVLGGASPAARIYRNVTGVTGPVVKEFSMIPAQRGPQSSGAFQAFDAYRKITSTPVPSLLRVTNTGASPNLFNLIILWTELEF